MIPPKHRVSGPSTTKKNPSLNLDVLDRKEIDTVMVYLPGRGSSQGRFEPFQVKASIVTQRIVRLVSTMVLSSPPRIIDAVNLALIQTGTGEDFKALEFQGDLWLNFFLGTLVFKTLRRMFGQRRWMRMVSGKLAGCVRSNAVFSMLGFRIGLALSPTCKSTADRFEAMVHAIRQDGTTAVLETWIENVFTPLIEECCIVIAQHMPGNPQRIDLPNSSQNQAAYHEDDDGYIIIDDDSDDETEIVEMSSVAAQPPSPRAEEAEVDAMLDVPLPYTQEWYNYKAKALTVHANYIRVNVPRLGERGNFKVDLGKCTEAVESYKHIPKTNQIEVIWKPSVGAEDEDDEIQMNCLTSWIAPGSSIRVWIAYRDKELDRTAATTLVHPWDHRAFMIGDQS